MLTGKLDILQETRAPSPGFTDNQEKRSHELIKGSYERVMSTASEQSESCFFQIMTSTKNDSLELRLILPLCAINQQIINFPQHSSDPFNNSRIYVYRSLITI